MSRTINWMKAWELKQLLKDTIDNINKIEESITQIDTNLWSTNESSEKVDSLLFDVEEAYNEIYGFDWDENHEAKDSKLEKLKEAYNKIIVGDDENWALKTEIEEFVTYIETNKWEVDSFKKQIFWYTNKKEDWTEEKVEWLFDNINNFHTNQQEKFKTLYDKIDEELTAWTTSVALAKVFSDKVTDYNKENNKWSNIFIFIIIFILWYYAISTIGNESIKTLPELWNFLLLRTPFFAMAIWLLIFIWNRRAEAKKLEEAYKHKEVMARAYVWYCETIKDLDTTDNQLLENHMSNLLGAIKTDSSEFLSAKWENHPFFDLFKKWTKTDFKEFKDILSEFNIDISNKNK